MSRLSWFVKRYGSDLNNFLLFIYTFSYKRCTSIGHYALVGKFISRIGGREISILQFSSTAVCLTDSLCWWHSLRSQNCSIHYLTGFSRFEFSSCHFNRLFHVSRLFLHNLRQNQFYFRAIFKLFVTPSYPSQTRSTYQCRVQIFRIENFNSVYLGVSASVFKLPSVTSGSA